MEKPHSVRWHMRRLEALKNKRESYMSHWRNLSDYILPRRGSFLDSQQSMGREIQSKIIDSTATHALNILVSGIMTGVISEARKWFEFITPDPEMKTYGPVAEWVDLLEKRCLRIFSESNFYRVSPPYIEELGLFGTASMRVEKDEHYPGGVFWKDMTAGQFVVSNDKSGRVFTHYEEPMLTVEQIAQMYVHKRSDWENVSEGVKSAYMQGKIDQEFPVISCVYPNPNANTDSEMAENFRFRHMVFEKSSASEHDGKILHTGGFRRFPYLVTRWYLKGSEVYGRSPGMEVLGDVRQLQEQQEKKGIGLSKQMDPPMVGSVQLQSQRTSTLPGDVTFVDDVVGGFRPAYEVTPKLSDFVMDMEDVRARIRRGLYSDLFLMMVERRGVQPLNDAELFERKEEKLLALGPLMGRLGNEFLSPAIDIVVDVALKSLPPPPPELQGRKLEIEYLNMITMAQRAHGLQGLRDTIAFAADTATAKANIGLPADSLDILDTDAAVRSFAEARGVDAKIIRDDASVAEIRDVRNQQQQQQARMAAQQQVASTAKDAATAAETATRAEGAMQ